MYCYTLAALSIWDLSIVVLSSPCFCTVSTSFSNQDERSESSRGFNNSKQYLVASLETNEIHHYQEQCTIINVNLRSNS